MTRSAKHPVRHSDRTAGLAANRAAALAANPVSRETLARLDRFVETLLTWQRRINLIAPATIPQLWTRHVADSLQLVGLAPGARVWVDLGSGGGFPGLVIACALAGKPDAVVHLVESNTKKAAFLREARRITGSPAVVHAVRIEYFVDTFRDHVDIVTARALVSLRKLYDHSAPLLERGAQGLFPKGQDLEAELTEASKYWNINDIRLVPSRTDRTGRIVVVPGLERRGTV